MSQPVGSPVDWNPPPHPGPARLEGRTVAVAPLTPAHFSSLWEAFSADPGEMWTYMSVGPFSDRDEFEATTASYATSTDPLFFAFETDRAGGWGSYLRITPEHGALEVGNLAFAPSFRRSVAATEAMYLMMRHAFELGYRRYEWKCDSHNAASRRAAERLGFTYEGTFRQHMVYKGRNRDTSWYSVVDSEWPNLQDAFEEWLDPANFDATGNQRRRLGEIRQDR